jgi:Asp-tRNA(Asn)/Glu-tRNA(Gln) amidotransferase A subunit family amidase
MALSAQTLLPQRSWASLCTRCLHSGRILRKSSDEAERLLVAPIGELVAATREGSTSCTKVAEVFAAQQQKWKHLNAFITDTPQSASATARELDASRGAAANCSGALRGVPIAIKDNFCTEVRDPAGVLICK